MTSNPDNANGETGGLLDRAEVDFLLDAGEAPAPAKPEQRDASDREPAEVTMRGDLDKINLTDIFQTLALSKMEGMLCISTPIEKRDVFFRDGFVRCLVSSRAETLRLGQRLVRAGHATAEDLRSALLEQKKSRTSLGTVLIERGLISADEVDDIVSNQLQEELFSLFTWRHGSFAFYKGPPTDPVTIERVERTPEFETNGVLLEVARRSDEWQRVFEQLGSLDELFGAISDDLPAAIDTEEHRQVLELADGTRNVRDLADAALLELFECAIIVRELANAGIVEQTPIDDALTTVGDIIDNGDSRRAQLVLEALLQRDDPLDNATVRRAADLLGRCGERRRAAEFLCRVAEHCFDAEERIELNRLARDLDRRSPTVLRALLGAARAASGDHADEVLTLRLQLIDLLIDDHSYEEAAELLRVYEADTDDLDNTRPRLAQALARLGDVDGAVEALLGLAETLDQKQDKKRLTAVYEQVLRIDYRRKDVAKRLKTLHASKLARRTTHLVTAAVAVAVLSAGVVWYHDSERETYFTELAQGIRLPNAAGIVVQDGTDPAAAQQAFATFELELTRARGETTQAVSEHGEHPALSAKQAQIANLESKLRAARGQLAERRCNELHDDAIDLLGEGELRTALITWDLTKGLGRTVEQLDDDIRSAIYEKIDAARIAVDERRGKLPGEPSASAQRDLLELTLQRIDTELQIRQGPLLRALDAARDDQRISDLFDRDRQEFEKRLGAVSAYLRQVDELRQKYAVALQRTQTAEGLTPLYNRAQEYERTFRFAEALEAYRELASSHPEEDELKARFRSRVQRYASILRYLDLLARATADGDFASATGQLALLRRQYPEIPFDDFVQLPVRVETQPEGAQVFLDGAPVGRAPLVTAYRPGVENHIRIELDGFHAEETVLQGDRIGKVSSLLARRALWTHQPASTIDQPLLVDDTRGQLVYTDRGGHIAAVNAANGDLRWTVSSGDVSGLLTSPVQLRGRSGAESAVVIGSVDGPLRTFDLADGRLRWETPDLPCDAAPVSARGLVGVATLDREFVVVGIHDGKVVGRTRLPGPVEADLALFADRYAMMVTVDGQALSYDILDRSASWTTEVGLGAVTPPLLVGDVLIIVSDDGRVVALDARSGEQRWTRRDFAGLQVRPSAAEGRLFLAEARSLHVLDLRNGRSLRTDLFDHELRGALSMLRGLLFCAEADGTVHAMAPRDLAPRYLLRAAGPALTPLAGLPGQRYAVAFGDRTLQTFGPTAGAAGR